MEFHALPTRTSGAAEAMATDLLLLQRYPQEHDVRFRHYGWHRPAFTFGYSQKIAFVRAHVPPEAPVELCRRPTGGGVVDHRHDWTYALVIPRGHAAYDARAIESYRIVHACLAEVLRTAGVAAELKSRCESTSKREDSGPGVCFAQPELYDVVGIDSGQKIAGAAQKRSKHGLLFQGSISRASLGGGLDWDAFQEQFTTKLAECLELRPREMPWPDWNEDELSQLVEHYSSLEWNEFR